MPTWLTVFHWLGFGFLVAMCTGIAIRAVAQQFRDTVRRMEVVRAFSSLRQWADTHGFLILRREQVWDRPFLEKGGSPIVFRVVVQDRSGQRKWARVMCGANLEVRWIKPESSLASSWSKNDPLWDQELDAS
jgi:hypothetical protein